MEDNLTPKNTDEQLIAMVRSFENAEEVTRPAREKSEKCRDYFDDKQLTADEESELKKRGQPPVVFNEIKPKIKTMMGLEKQTRKDPKAFPRNPDDEDAARAATDAIRYVCEDSRWDDKRSRASKNLAIEGTCAVKIGLKQTKSGIDPDVRSIAWDRFYADPHSADDDFDDAQFLGEVIWTDLDDAVLKFPDGKEALEATWAAARDSETYDDRPKYNLWADYKRKRVRLCEHYYIEDGKWMFCIFTKAGFVVEPRESPYIDADGEPECPIKAISLYVDRDNNRYGEVQAMLSPQDEVNKRRSKALHVSNTRQIRVSPNVSMDPNEVRKELARPDGVFIGENGDVDILNTADMLMGNLNLLQDAREHIHRTGANSAMAGKDTGGQSGKAIALQQMGGMTEAADYLDCIRRLSLAVYRSVWGRVRQAWKEERWIRVTDDEKTVRFVGLNKQTPITAGMMMVEQSGITKDNIQQQDPQMVQALEAFVASPQGQQVISMKTENDVAQLDVDIIVDEGIDTPTIQAEQFDQLSQIMPGLVNLPPAYAKMLIQASSLRDKDLILETLEEMNAQPQVDPAQEQMMQMMQQLQMALAEAEVRKVQSEATENEADAAAKMAGIQIDAMEAGSRAAA